MNKDPPPEASAESQEAAAPELETEEEIEEIRAFFNFAGGDSFSLDDLDEMMKIKAEYEDETCKLFYIIADSLIYTSDEVDGAEYILFYKALIGSDMTDNEFSEWVE